MKVLVTGGAGYIGSTLVPLLLSKGHMVRVLDRLTYGGSSLLGNWSDPNFQLVKGDVRDAGVVDFALQDIDAVVHLAAIVGDPACSKEPDLAYQINRDASLELYKKANQLGATRFVFASTCSNYGRMVDRDGLVDESSELRPISVYAKSKVEVENQLLEYARTERLQPTMLRFATAYGVSPRLRFDLTVNQFTMEMMVKKKLTVFGEQFWRPYAHVGDISRAILAVLEAPLEKVGGQVFNVGASDQNFQKQQIVELIKPYCPDVQVEYVHKDEDPRDYKVSFEKIHSTLGFENQYTVPGGIKEFVELANSQMIDDFERAEYRNS